MNVDEPERTLLEAPSTVGDVQTLAASSHDLPATELTRVRNLIGPVKVKPACISLGENNDSRN